MITKYYEFLINCVDKGFDEHYITGVIITIIVCAVISAFVVQIEKTHKGLAVFATTSITVLISISWPLIIYIIAGILLPFALIIGMIYGLSKIISYMSMSKH